MDLWPTLGVAGMGGDACMGSYNGGGTGTVDLPTLVARKIRSHFKKYFLFLFFSLFEHYVSFFYYFLFFS